MKTLAQLWSYLKIKFRKVRASDSDGNPLAGGKLYTYSAGTSKPLSEYSDSTERTSNPVILESAAQLNNLHHTVMSQHEI